MKVTLIGNYEPDRQRSMAVFGEMLQRELVDRAIPVALVKPKPKLGFHLAPRVTPLVRKWLAYVDKYVFFPLELEKLARGSNSGSHVFHIIDHSNAMYERPLRRARVPHVITCHDMLAVRGGLGDASAFCQASKTGVFLQKWILSSLKRIPHVGCVSETTRRDVVSLTLRQNDHGLLTVLNAPNAPFVTMPKELCASAFPNLSARPYLLMVGSSLPRKNRACAIRVMAKLKSQWNGIIGFAFPSSGGNLGIGG